MRILIDFQSEFCSKCDGRVSSTANRILIGFYLEFYTHSELNSKCFKWWQIHFIIISLIWRWDINTIIKTYTKADQGPGHTKSLLLLLIVVLLILLFQFVLLCCYSFCIIIRIIITDQMCYFTIMQHFSDCDGSAIFRVSANKKRKLHQFLSTSDAIWPVSDRFQVLTYWY
jgi:FlaA1/EpsC-like NDP-sugar epimerase